jgi:hypothetical protein
MFFDFVIYQKFTNFFWELEILKNLFFFESAILDLFIQKNKWFFCFIFMKICQRFLDIKDGTKFLMGNVSWSFL